ncbi:MAG: HIT domain-containing protein [Actinomycetota bacterium]
MERIFSGWRAVHGSGLAGDGRPHADLDPVPGQSLFETLERSGLPDAETYILERRATTFSILNVYPYTSGHVMVLPRRAVTTMDELDDPTLTELWLHVRDAARAVKTAFRPQGLNIGLNEGTAGGGSVPDHLHVHIVPRWSADTNFMTTIAEARIVPMTLTDTWEALRAVWAGPASGDDGPLP